MRELKFKAYVPELNKTVDVIGLNPINKTVYLSHYQLSGSEGDDVLISFDKSDESHVIVRQFSGHKDNNGVEVYEGDIVSDYDDGAYPYEIVFNNERSQFMKSRGRSESMLMDLKHQSLVGNIYENPELLEKS